MEREFALREVLPDHLARICFEYVNPARVLHNHMVKAINHAFQNSRFDDYNEFGKDGMG